MTFAIDTGDSYAAPAAAAWGRVGRNDVIDLAVADQLPPDAPQSARDALVVSIVLGELHKSKLLETVRSALVQMWPVIARLAETDPDGFDEIIGAYAELVTTLPATRSEAIARRKASEAGRLPVNPVA